MPGSPQSTLPPTPPPWDESDSFRETGLLCVDDPQDREALRRVGRLIYDMSVEVSQELGVRELGGESSMTRAELRAVVADLRYLEGYLATVRREADESTLPHEDIALRLRRQARPAGRRHCPGDREGAVMSRQPQPGPERTQTGVRMERRLLKVLKALAELYDLSLAEFLEDLIRDAFAGRQPLSEIALAQAAELMRIYGLDHADLSPAVVAAPAQEGE